MNLLLQRCLSKANLCALVAQGREDFLSALCGSLRLFARRFCSGLCRMAPGRGVFDRVIDIFENVNDTVCPSPPHKLLLERLLLLCTQVN